MQHDAPTPDATQAEPIVAVFDTKTVALRTVHALLEAGFDDIWLGVVRGETDDGETIVASEQGDEILLYRALSERGTVDEHAHRYDGIVPPGSAVMSLRAQGDRAIRIIELTGGHIEHI